jgi:hypothetical protein
MEPLLFYFPVLRALGSGKLIRSISAIMLRIQAALTLIAGLYLIVMTLKAGFEGYVPASFTFGAVLVALLELACAVAVAQVFLFRADSVLALPDGPYTVIPILSIHLRCAGEVYATLLVAGGLAGTLFLWMANVPLGYVAGPLRALMPDLGFHASNNFLAGLVFLVSMLSAAFFAILVSYFLAEAVIVLVDIARHIQGLSHGVGTSSAPSKPLCPSCGIEMEPGAAFCENCGQRVG